MPWKRSYWSKSPIIKRRSSCSFWGLVSYLKWHLNWLRDGSDPPVRTCSTLIQGPPTQTGFIFVAWPVTEHPAADVRVQEKGGGDPHGVIKAARLLLCGWTITAMLNLLWMATSTFLAGRRACVFDSSTPIKRFCGWSQRRWVKEKGEKNNSRCCHGKMVPIIACTSRL